MAEYLVEMDCKYRSDSIMMKLLRSAMDKAHERVQSKGGPVECLHERSKFYELAIIQIKGCYSLIQEETDSSIPESNRVKMLTDLIELQDLLQTRLKEMKNSIAGKDKELSERLENEYKLRQALEFKERELWRSRENIEIERTKSEGFQDFLLNLKGHNGDENKQAGEISDLKNSVDQQVSNIKQRLEEERLRKSTSNSVDLEFDTLNEDLYEDEYGSETKDLSPNSLRSDSNMVIEQMSSDIDILEGTLKLAFGRMQSAEVRPLEEQWKWAIEKDTASIVIKGFVRDIKQGFEIPDGFSNEHLLDLIDEMTRLRGELETLISRNESIAKRDNTTGNDRSTPPKPLILRTSSEPLLEFDYMEDPSEEDLAVEGSNYVAKLIKNHESFIRRQQKKLHIILNKEGFGRKGFPSPENEKESKFTEKKIREVVERLDNVTKWKHKLHPKIPVHPKDEKRKSRITGVCYNKELKGEIKRLKQEMCESELQALAMEDTYTVLCKGLMEDFSLEIIHGYDIESFIREEIYFTICREAANDFVASSEFALEEYQSYCLGSKLKSNQLDFVLWPLMGFQKLIVDFEKLVHEKLQRNHLRLKKVKQIIGPIFPAVTSVRKEELLYKKAFARRCHNLRLAENEVDLLGDEVDVLLGLLQKIYLKLDQHAPILSRYFEVSDILKLIKEELNK